MSGGAGAGAGDSALKLVQLQSCFRGTADRELLRVLTACAYDLPAAAAYLAHEAAGGGGGNADEGAGGEARRTHAPYGPLVKPRTPLGRTGVQIHGWEISGAADVDAAISAKLKAAAPIASVAALNAGSIQAPGAAEATRAFLAAAQRGGWISSVAISLADGTLAPPTHLARPPRHARIRARPERRGDLHRVR